MVEAIQNYIGSLNWGYRVSLREKTVTYLNAYAEFIEPHKVKVYGVCVLVCEREREKLTLLCLL